jgi:hypothetical protein
MSLSETGCWKREDEIHLCVWVEVGWMGVLVQDLPMIREQRYVD